MKRQTHFLSPIRKRTFIGSRRSLPRSIHKSPALRRSGFIRCALRMRRRSRPPSPVSFKIPEQLPVAAETVAISAAAAAAPPAALADFLALAGLVVVGPEDEAVVQAGTPWRRRHG